MLTNGSTAIDLAAPAAGGRSRGWRRAASRRRASRSACGELRRGREAIGRVLGQRLQHRLLDRLRDCRRGAARTDGARLGEALAR